MGNVFAKKEGASSPPTSLKGLYHHCDWDQKTVKKLILEKRLAPIYHSFEEQVDDSLEECPICFLFYPGGLNRSKCCHKGMCTECFLQIKRPVPHGNAICPFCNSTPFSVEFTGPLSREELEKEAQEQLKVLELKVQMRKEEIERDRERELEKERIRKESLSLTSSSPIASSMSSSPSLSTSLPQSCILSQNSLDSSPSPQKKSTLMNKDTLSGTSVETNDSRSQSFPSGVTIHDESYFSSSSYPPNNRQHISSSPLQDTDIEDLMLKEAIRLSLMDSVEVKQNSQSIAITASSSGVNNSNNIENDTPRKVGEEGDQIENILQKIFSGDDFEKSDLNSRGESGYDIEDSDKDDITDDEIQLVRRKGKAKVKDQSADSPKVSEDLWNSEARSSFHESSHESSNHPKDSISNTNDEVIT